MSRAEFVAKMRECLTAIEKYESKEDVMGAEAQYMERMQRYIVDYWCDGKRGEAVNLIGFLYTALR